MIRFGLLLPGASEAIISLDYDYDDEERKAGQREREGRRKSTKEKRILSISERLLVQSSIFKLETFKTIKLNSLIGIVNFGICYSAIS